MTGPAAELALMIRQTQAFVNADPETIVITPAVSRVSDGAGGHQLVPGTPFEHVCRLIPQGGDQKSKVPTVSTWEGTRAVSEYVLLDVPSAAELIYKGDTFTWRGQTWKVLQIHDKPDYTFKADVVLDVG